MSWGHTEKNCKFKMGFNGVVTYYSVLLWNYKHLLGQCGCLILIVKVIDATYIGSIEEFKILSASGHIPGNLPPWGGSTPETGFADFSKCFFFLSQQCCVPSSRFRRHILRHKVRQISFHGVLCSMESVRHINTLWALVYCTEQQSMASLVSC